MPATCKDYQEIKIQEQVGNDVCYYFLVVETVISFM